MVVQHNMNAINAYNRLNANVAGLRKASEKLASGYRINRAGDDAAGLAISEKMRSQIRGLNQAVRNSQDGINMIQTFEGAAQETHNILQRMKELAVESANGTYDNATDRAAIQLEFEQLNDELNQIADTDFNGTVVLNGGQMADGLKAVDGEFNYANKAGQVAEEQATALAEAQAAAQKAIDKAQKTFDAAKASYNATTNRDFCVGGDAVQWNTIDDNNYTSAVAKSLFDNAVVSGSTDSLNSKNVESFNVQFVFDGTDWKIASSATIGGVQDTDGNNVGKDITIGDTTITTGAWYINDDGEVVEVDISGVTGFTDNDITTTSNGGFIVNGNKFGNAIFASKEAKAGDVVTLTYTNTPNASYAPTNIGIDEESLVDRVGLINAPKLELSDAAKDNNNMDQEMMDALTKLDKANIEFLYTKDGIQASIDNDDLIIESNGLSDDGLTESFTISFKNQDGKLIELATVTTQAAHDASDAKHAVSTGDGQDGPVTATKGYSDGADGDLAATSVDLIYKEGKWVYANDTSKEFDFSTDTTFTGTAGGLGKQVTDFVSGTAQEGDKMKLYTSGVTTSGSNASIEIDYTAADKSSFTNGTAATSDAEMEFTWNGTQWVNAEGKEYSEWVGETSDFGGIDLSNATGVDNPNYFVDGGNGDKVGDKLIVSATKGSKVVSASVKAAEATVGKVTFGVALDEGKYDPSSMKPTIDAAVSPNGTDSRAIDKAYEDAKQALSDAKAAYPATYEDLGVAEGVTKADAYDNSTAIMTYKEEIILQTGARTKDAVNFTFSYNRDGTADMGNLIANLNLSAREDGLNTASLSLANQDDANYAIDQIDKAINKTSMVRATFGAIQNRLEHKITNLTTTAENLTEAESSIRDTDMASEMMNFTKYNILQQAAQSMLAQANQQPQSILQLLG